MKSGTLLRQVINKLNEIDFHKQQERHLFNDLYEKILRDLQSAGNAGEYYTPRAVTQFMVDMVNPRVGEVVLDPACGTAGFLVCALEHMKGQARDAADLLAVERGIRGVEKKPLPHVLAMTNLFLHGVSVPNIARDNALTRQPYRAITGRDRVDVIMTNPPLWRDGGTGRGERLPGRVPNKRDGRPLPGADYAPAEGGRARSDCAAGWLAVWRGGEDAH